MRVCPKLKSSDKGSGQAQAIGSSNAPKKNCFYALRSMGEQETSLNFVTAKLKFLSLGVYVLLDPGAIL